MNSHAAVTGPVTVLRFTQIYGRGDHDLSVVSRFIREVRERGEVVVQGRGTATRDLIYIADAVTIVAHFVKHPVTTTVNVASGVSHAIRDVAMLAATCQNITPNIRFVEHIGVEATHEFDTAHLRSVFPGGHFRTLEEGVGAHISSRWGGPPKD